MHFHLMLFLTAEHMYLSEVSFLGLSGLETTVETDM